ncbi:MAG: tetratricopeptide repeat protein [Candidatus Villigracilaceae bacterium]
MNVPSRHRLFSRQETASPYRLAFYIFLILGLLWLLRQVDIGQIQPLFLPTPTPTRSALSYALEGDALFVAGKLDAAIAAYQQALQVDPNDALVWAKLARIQTYSSALLTTDPQRLARLQEAQASADKAVELAPDDSSAHAIRAFVLDWHANPSLIGEKAAQELLTQAEQEAVRALQLDNQNTLALAFYAEILVDQQKWAQAEQYIRQALEKDPSLMDVHRVYAYVLETFGQYNQAITEYDKAIAITPNLTFLYLRAGANYRRLAFGSASAEQAESLYTRSLEYFDKAARLNQQLGIQDPIPYMSIAKTYSQMGEYFIAGRNMQKAIELDPGNPDLYGQLGIIFFKSRNYEGSIPAFRCAIYGCTAEESCQARYGRACDPNFGEAGADVQGLALSDSTVVYYYTYGSVLAALSRPRDNQCAEAMTILSQVKQAYGSDPDIGGIVHAGEQICQSLGPP